jgi:pimeloyl-ACP methyl ester carboxylesterase
VRTREWWPDPRFWIVLCCALVMGCQGVSVWRVVTGPGARSFSSGARPDAGLSQPVDRSAGDPLEAIAGAAAAMTAGPTAEARDRYNAALEDLLRLTGRHRIHRDRGWRDHLDALGIRVVEPEREGDGRWSPDRFDLLLFSHDFVVRGMERQYRTEGLGVPMIAVRNFEPDKSERAQGQDRFLMPREVYPLTAILHVVSSPGNGGRPAGSREYRLELRDPLTATSVEFAGRPTPMASDLTTPLAYHLARSPLPVLQEVGLLDPGTLDRLEGLYMLHPYQPGKIPIVFVHGLRSSPLAWLKDINEVWGDPVLRERYQVWLYMYPTGEPLPSTAAGLREDLDRLRQAIDSQHADPMLDRMVMIGHSLGGLICKMMILESGDAVWRVFSNRPFEELNATPQRREQVRQHLFFSANPSVARVIFVATPHLGSELGDELIGRITDRLIRLPRTLRSTYRDLMASNPPGFFTPVVRNGRPTSIEELRLDNPFLLALARLPRRMDVPVHSIIGRKEPDLPLNESSDGVVPYRSSHLDWAQSECVVQGDHMCQDIPETLHEIRRILFLHLEELPASLR